MTKKLQLKHPIQKHILRVLSRQKTARFRDMRPPKVDTNLYSYHLKVLQKLEIIDKQPDGYSLGKLGLKYVEANFTESTIRPKIFIMFVIQNSDGQLLLEKRAEQPFVGSWSLPYGELLNEDLGIQPAAIRIVTSKLGLQFAAPIHAGDCYIREFSDDEVVYTAFAHIFRLEDDTISEKTNLKWAKPHRLTEYELAPAVEQIVARTFFRDPHYFEEFSA